MTTAQQAFEAAQKERLRERAALILATDEAVIGELAAARDEILRILADQPADWQRVQLAKLLDQINAALEGATGRAATALDGGLRSAWDQGEAFVDKPLAAGGFNVHVQLPVLNTDLLVSLRQFAALRIKDVGVEAARKIGQQLSLVTLGASTPYDAIKKVQAQLGDESVARARTIVHTEVARSFAMSSQQRMEQAAKIVPLQKKWRRSGKVHSRWNHDAIDGQIREVGEPFKVPTLDGVIDMMYPHDPTAPASEVINCGCLALQVVKGWNAALPGAKPFTAEEIRQDGRKAAIAQMAQRTGLRSEPHPDALPNFDSAEIPAAKLVDYALNPDHVVGGNKARVFKSALGFTTDNAQMLEDEIRAGLKANPAVKTAQNDYGALYRVDMALTGPAGTAIVRTSWILEDGGDAPRLTSAFVKPKP